MGGLDLLRRCLRRIELPRRLQGSGDYGGARLALLLLALPYVRARPCSDGIASKTITDYFPDHVSHD